ncbi:DUF2189 domain-containing protein [uncultured Tateyamaria sp.]|uniref:DUF2189 domain-containing protein n=1 Tax=uncultured Tateyamaria sp. TaxID=455651 RepID=UPI002603FE3B|nr:DUF2189 domain-containing protein [uncultured Tateyamaria sp.]
MTAPADPYPALPMGVPPFQAPPPGFITHALRAGWRDFRAAPGFGLLTALTALAAGWLLFGLTLWAGHTFWLILAVFGFPLVAPLCALGNYEVSRRIGAGQGAGAGAVIRQLWVEKGRQLPWLSMLMVVALLFWFFLGHMIFALFLGLKPMVNVTTSLDVFLSADGLMMIGLGTLVGGAFALLFYGICVLGLPLLLAREVDYMTAILSSIAYVQRYPGPMLGWAAVIVVLLFLAMLPGLLGVLVVLPWLGHASWHVYAQIAAGAR